jgi:hypothetical protein
VVALAVTAGVMAVALVAAAGGRADNRELRQRLVPAAAAAGALLSRYQAGQTALRDYVTKGNPAALAPYRLAIAQVPGQQARTAVLLRRYPVMRRELAAAQRAQRAWLARVARPQLTAVRSGHLARAQALQADIPRTRPYTLALRSAVETLQAQIVRRQGVVTRRLASTQQVLLEALIAVVAVVALIAAGAVVVVRRWLLAPFTAVRQAAEAVAAGEHDVRVPAAGPAELADLGHAAELMRTRLVTALASAEQAETRFRVLFQSAPDPTLTVEADGSVMMANAQAERMFGWGAGELAGQPVQVLIPRTERDPREYLAQLGSEPEAGIVRQAVTRDGRELPVEITVCRLPAESGKAAATVSMRDISERLAALAEQEQLRDRAEKERYEARMAQSQRLESLGQLVGGVAHDFNNLLNVITGYADLLSEQLQSPAARAQGLESMAGDVDQVRGAADRAVALTRQLLTFARRDVVRPEVLDIAEVITGVEQLLRRTLGEHITLDITAPQGLRRIKADPGQIEQVLVNLAVNARDAMPGGGTLTIDAADIDADDAYTTIRPGLATGRYLRLRVSDTGTGMDRDTLARVFEPFYTTKPQGKGTGLGLATVYGIITGAGGYPQIYSESGLGTTITALLPATDAAATTAVPASAAPAPGRGETILLVEDEHSLSQLASRILTASGYHVRAAASPADAIRLAADPGQPADLLLTDVVMPDMLGNEVAARIHQIRPALPVLYMSGYAQPVLNTQGALDPDVELLEKPFTTTTLLTRVRTLIDTNGQPR